MCLWLIFVAEVRLGSPPLGVAYCSDSSVTGFALHLTRVSPSEFHDVAAYRERWRFEVREVEWEAKERIDEWQPGAGALLDDTDSFEDYYEFLHTLPAMKRPLWRWMEAVEATADSVGILSLPSSLLVRARWRLVTKGAWRWASDIMDLEGAICLMRLRRVARQTCNH